MVEWMWVSWETEERAPMGIVVEKERRSGRREGWRGRRGGGILCEWLVDGSRRYTDTCFHYR